MHNIHWVDFLIIVSMLLLVTMGGHLLTGEKIKDVAGFFKGGNNMPWWAVSASIIATKISALTFIALPSKVFVDGGNIEYILLISGFILGNILMAVVFVKPYYEEKIYSPYDFIQKRIHPNTAILARVLFLAGTILSQSIRLLATAVVLHVISGFPIIVCIAIIILFSVVWSWLGGIQTVIWTDLLLFIIFILGALVAIYSSFSGVDLSLPEVIKVLDDKSKLAIMNISLDPKLTYTLWTGLIGAAVFELGSNAIDQVITQRIMCCKDVKQARKAVFSSAFSVVPSLMMLCVGLGITIFFHQNKLPESVSYLQNAGQDGIFPYFVANHIPVGLSGLIIAGMFASGISTLDSALTALSQTTVMGIRKSLANTEIIKSSELLRKSRHFVGIWGIIMLVITISLWLLTKKSDTGLLDIGLQIPGFVYGSLLGLALLAIHRHKGWESAFIGAIVACVFTIFLWVVNVSFFWWYPVASIVTFGVAYLLNKMFKI